MEDNMREKGMEIYYKTEENMKKYIDMDKFNAIYEFLYARKELYSNINDNKESFRDNRRKEVLELYLKMDKNDVDFFLAKNLKEGLESNSKAIYDVSKEISQQHFN
ncbi:hypothetical protein [Staphylococcus phage vB_StaM_SA1]|nr:hypothetical protein [Staphylococcus phage vB_StaM_SA1]